MNDVIISSSSWFAVSACPFSGRWYAVDGEIFTYSVLNSVFQNLLTHIESRTEIIFSGNQWSRNSCSINFLTTRISSELSGCGIIRRIFDSLSTTFSICLISIFHFRQRVYKINIYEWPFGVSRHNWLRKTGGFRISGVYALAGRAATGMYRKICS